MRKTILHDIGNPKMKKEVLDLIENLSSGKLLEGSPEDHAKELMEKNSEDEEVDDSKGGKGASHRTGGGDAQATLAMMHEENQERRFQEMQEAIEKFILDSKREIDHVESRMIQGINKEQQRVSKEIETIGLKLEKRVDELAIYHNALKDENDRLSDRLQANTSEIVQFQK